MSYLYQVFGLRLAADRPLTGLQPISSASDVDTTVHFAAMPWGKAAADRLAGAPDYVSPFCDDRGRPLTQAWEIDSGAFSRLLLSDDSEFVLDRGGRQIWIDRSAVSDETIESYLLGPILSLALRRRGIVCLHASAVGLHGRAIAFAGAEGAGKSTIAALFAMHGGPVLTDDVAALSTSGANAFPVLVNPGAQFLRVRPGEVERAALTAGRRSDFRRTSDGEYLDLDLASIRSVARKPLPLGAIYYLDSDDRRATDASRDRDIVQPIGGAEALMLLVGDTWGTRLLDKAQRAHEFDLLATIVSRVPMRRVARSRCTGPWDVVERISHDVRSLSRE